MAVPAMVKEMSCSEIMKQRQKQQCVMEKKKQKEDGCCKKENTCCVCFYGFQVMAPVHILSKFRFLIAQEKNMNGHYRQPGWNNPFIDGPLQPPDVV